MPQPSTTAAPGAGRHLLFLQGPPSGFARSLGAALLAEGARVSRINLCAGDWLYWHGAGTVSYRGSLARWPEWLGRWMDREGVTDLLYFADCHPCNRAARAVAEARGIRVTAYENGYLRPDWVAAEPGGQGVHSCLTTDIDRLREAAQGLPRPRMARQYRHDPGREARGDMVYHLANWLAAPLYPRYRRDRPVNPVIDYLSYIPGDLRAGRRLRRAEALRARLCGPAAPPFFLVILQMQADYQVRANSPWSDQRAYLAHVIDSFAAHAAPGTELVIKVHPHENGLVNWRAEAARLAAGHRLEDRVRVIHATPLEDWLQAARGMVTINSTSGLAALQAGCPVICRGVAIYDLPGLTHDAGLASFWTDPQVPDAQAVADVVSVLAHHLHVRGDLYGPGGLEAAVAALAARLLDANPLPAIFERTPPRHAAARRMGVPLDD